ncbi:hypothetical protein LY78DRAFT_661416 [Colletotrichum sublineola]|uniref:Uncharacterized protein n=1 Tax=Colletotrichum sublineola TaxID=1173701 RepID=A0A066Y143_COLSU|nr:hypothetical protein LY78DRAFT_661416 [Colletotrichum sublineola]KDN71950.1 hypothetical protein CSUB01_11564 [Colletotrichum sublineola]
MLSNKEAVKVRQKEEEERRKTEEGVRLRKKQGQDTTTGEQVWYSRRVEDGCQLHWAIITHGNKYELRLPNGIPSREKVPDSTFEPPREYEARVVPWLLKEETNRLRTLELTKPGKGHTRDYVICQIGWTTLTKDQVNAEWDAARKALAVDALGFDDCRNLLKNFACIIKKPDGCALDYGWFAETLEIPSHRLHEITPERATKSFQHMLQNGGWILAGAGAGAGAGIAYGAYEAAGRMESAGTYTANAGVTDGLCAAYCCCGSCGSWDCDGCDCGGCEWLLCFPCAGGAC